MTPQNPPDPAASPHFELSPDIADSLHAAGAELADEVRREVLHGPRPVFLYYLAQTFTLLNEELAQGVPPATNTHARQLCLHLMIDRAETGRPGYRAVRAALLPDGMDRSLTVLRPVATASGRRFDFTALGAALDPHGMSDFFAPFAPDDLVA